MEIILTAQTGGPESGKLFRNEIVKLRKSLKLLGDKQYAESLKKAKIFLRISGSIDNFHKPTGIHYWRYSKPGKTYSADIIIARDTWQNGEGIKEILSKLTKEYFRFMIEYLTKKRINDIDSDQLLQDIDGVVMDNFFRH